MGVKSDIGWCDSTFNGWIGCTKKSTGCRNCYAKALMEDRFKKAVWGPMGRRVKTAEFYWKQPARWNNLRFYECQACGFRDVYKPEGKCEGCGHPLPAVAITTRRRVFAHSLSDVFESRPELIPWRAEELQIYHATPNLDWIVLSKYIENVEKFTPDYVFPINVALGTSAEDQYHFEERWAILREISKVGTKFLSVEPMLGPVDISKIDTTRLDWVICGAESGEDRREFDPAWSVDLYRQCKERGIKFFMKQGSGDKSGVQGDVPDWLWSIKEFPIIGGAR